MGMHSMMNSGHAVVMLPLPCVRGVLTYYHERTMPAQKDGGLYGWVEEEVVDGEDVNEYCGIKPRTGDRASARTYDAKRPP